MTAFAVLLIANLSLGDKRIEQRVETLYAAAAPQFRRNMNGDQFFPDMLQAIGGARSPASRCICSSWRLTKLARINNRTPIFFHCKVMIVDELWVSVGSTNFDARSFSDDLARSRRITLEQWENRRWTEKLWEHTLGLFSSQL